MSKGVWVINGVLRLYVSICAAIGFHSTQGTFLGEPNPENKIVFPPFLFLTGTQSLEYNDLVFSSLETESTLTLNSKILQLQLAEFWDYQHIETSPTS